MSADLVAGWLGRARWRAAPGVEPAQLEARLAAVRVALAARPAPIRAGRRKTMYALALAGGAPDHLLKVESCAGRPLGRRLGRGAAALELARAAACAARGIATPLPLAAGSVRRRGVLEATLLLVPIVPGAADLAGLWGGGRAPRARRRAAASALGTFVRALHDAGVDQDDLAPNNFLWRDEPEPRVLAIDFERVRIVRRLADARRARSLARLDRHLAGASASDRLRFARAYGCDDGRAWWRAVAAAHGPLARRDFAHLLRTGTRASRRFAPVAAPGVGGWTRRAGPLDEALAAPDTPDGMRPRLWLTTLGMLDPRACARTWAAALVLAQRGAMPPPIALLVRADGCFLVAEREAGARTLASVAPHEARAPLIGLLDRLLAFGFEPDALARGSLLLAPRPGGGMRAELLDPRGLRPGRVSSPPGGARGWAARVIAGSG